MQTDSWTDGQAGGRLTTQDQFHKLLFTSCTRAPACTVICAFFTSMSRTLSSRARLSMPSLLKARPLGDRADPTHRSFCPAPDQSICNGHTDNTWLSPSLLDLHHESTHDLRSYLQVQVNQLCINHQCHFDAPVWTEALYKPLACFTIERQSMGCHSAVKAI